MTAIFTVADIRGRPDTDTGPGAALDGPARRITARVLLICAVSGGLAVAGYELWRGSGAFRAVLAGLGGAAVGAFLPFLAGFLLMALIWMPEGVLALLTLPLTLAALILPRPATLRVLDWNARLDRALVRAFMAVADRIFGPQSGHDGAGRDKGEQ
ncbi:MAG: hypothetical protein Q4G26_06685 [Paracoccus sp. (in: a-proteobacteria)]|nr:hypothetical protein [Paracoccus sp. (in: a-proteobacteria)]